MAVMPDLVDMAVHKWNHILADHIVAAEKHLAGLVYFDKGPELCLVDHGLEVAVDFWHTLDVLAGQKSEL
jgi:hypothetical protein